MLKSELSPVLPGFRSPEKATSKLDRSGALDVSFSWAQLGNTKPFLTKSGNYSPFESVTITRTFS